MGDLLAYLFSWAAWWVWLLILLGLALLIYMRHDSSFALTDLAYTFPVVGKLHRFARDYSDADDTWLNVENTLCRDYAKHMSALSQYQFENNILYLKKTYDHGRRPMPFWARAILILLIVMESVGFSFLLSQLMVTEGSENLHELLTILIVLVIAAILVWVTHAAGHQIYRTGLLRSCFREYQSHNDPAFSSRIVSLDDDQRTVDAGERAHVQCANRVITKPGDRGTYWWVWLAVFLILAIAIGSTKLRIETLHSAPADGGTFIANLFRGGDDAGAAPAAPAPAEDAAAARAREAAAMTGFAMLAVIFMVTQFVGMSLGYWYGFAGKQSVDAWRATRGAADYDIYWEPIQRRINIATARLYTLHRLLEQHSPHPLILKHTFLDFIREERGRGASHLQMPPQGVKALPAPAPEQPEEPEGAEPPEQEVAVEAPEGANGGGREPLAAALDLWDRTPGKEARIDLLAGLDDDLRGELQAALERRRAERDRRETLSRQFDGLFE